MSDLIRAFPDSALDEGRSELYRRSLSDLGDEQWSHAVEQTTKREMWFPTIARLREYAEERKPAPSAGVTPSTALPIEPRPFWSSVEEQQRTEAWVRANPRRSGEGWLSYTHRIAVGAGLMTDFTAPQGHALGARTEREPGEEG